MKLEQLNDCARRHTDAEKEAVLKSHFSYMMIVQLYDDSS